MITKECGTAISLALVLVAGCTQLKTASPSTRPANIAVNANLPPTLSGEKPELPCAYSSKPSEKSILSSQQFGYLTDMPEPIYASVGEMVGFNGESSQLRAALPQLIAPPSGNWQVTDVIVDPDLPRWRFMGGVKSKRYWHVWLQTGGIGKVEHVLIIQPEAGVRKVHIKAHFVGFYEDLCPLVQVLERVEFDGGTTERFEEWY